MGPVEPSLRFLFDLKHQQKLAALKPQETVTIRGQCQGRTTLLFDRKPEQAILFANCEMTLAK